MSLQAQIQTISKQATDFQRNVYIAFICTFFFGFLLLGGAYAVLVNLLLVRLGFGPEFVGLLNGFRPFLLTAVAITLIGVAIFWFNFLKDADATPSARYTERSAMPMQKEHTQ